MKLLILCLFFRYRFLSPFVHLHSSSRRHRLTRSACSSELRTDKMNWRVTCVFCFLVLIYGSELAKAFSPITNDRNRLFNELQVLISAAKEYVLVFLPLGSSTHHSTLVSCFSHRSMKRSQEAKLIYPLAGSSLIKAIRTGSQSDEVEGGEGYD